MAQLITRDEILNGQDKQFPLTSVMEANLRKLLEALNKFRLVYGKPMRVNSGYRPPEHNKKVGGAPNSPHLDCSAADFSDPDARLANYCRQNIKLLEDCGIYCEDFEHTKGWVHMQIRMPNSGKRVFLP